MNGQDTAVNKSVAQLATLFKSTLYIYLHQLYELYVYVYCCITCSPGADPGGGGGGGGASKIGKNKIFWRIIVIFHTKYPKYFRASLRSAQFF